MNQQVSNEWLLRALKNTLKGQLFDRELYGAMEKLSKGKRLKNLEFNEVYDVLFKPGPYVKYTSPEKWERVSCEFSAQNIVTQ